MCQNIFILNLPNRGDHLILDTDASNERWSTVLDQNQKKEEKLYKYYSESFNKVECNSPTME